MNHKNLTDEESDFVPVNANNDFAAASVRREPPIPVWHVASYKDWRENFIRAAETIQRKVGNIRQGNFKRYGRSILIKAGTDTQAMLLSNFRPSEEGNIQSVSPRPLIKHLTLPRE